MCLLLLESWVRSLGRRVPKVGSVTHVRRVFLPGKFRQTEAWGLVHGVTTEHAHATMPCIFTSRCLNAAQNSCACPSVKLSFFFLQQHLFLLFHGNTNFLCSPMPFTFVSPLQRDSVESYFKDKSEVGGQVKNINFQLHFNSVLPCTNFTFCLCYSSIYSLLSQGFPAFSFFIDT